MAHWNLFASKNLDVPETFHDPVSPAAKGAAGDLTPEPLLSVVCPDAAPGDKQRHRYRPYGSKHLSFDQATNLIEAVDYARTIGLPLVAHATIHWSGTIVFDDPDGKLFAKVREGLHKWLLRRGIAGGLTCVWCRECKAHTDIVHCHLLFYLPVEYRTGARFLQTEAALSRLVGRHGGGILGEFAVKLIIHPDPDGLYLIKGGDRRVWDHFKIRKEWRKSQGIVHGKRCGTTENIGLAERARYRHSLCDRRGASDA
jgi:hypothetical protein